MKNNTIGETLTGKSIFSNPLLNIGFTVEEYQDVISANKRYARTYTKLCNEASDDTIPRKLLQAYYDAADYYQSNVQMYKGLIIGLSKLTSLQQHYDSCNDDLKTNSIFNLLK